MKTIYAILTADMDKEGSLISSDSRLYFYQEQNEFIRSLDNFKTYASHFLGCPFVTSFSALVEDNASELEILAALFISKFGLENNVVIDFCTVLERISNLPAEMWTREELVTLLTIYYNRVK